MSLFGWLTGADAQNKAAYATLNSAKKQNKKMLELAEPALATQRSAFPMLRNFVGGYLRNQVGEDSPVLEAQRVKSVGRVERTRRASLAGSKRFFEATGNRSLGAGEEFRINDAADDSISDVNLGAAGMQEDRKTGAADRYFSGVNSMISAGQSGVQLASGGAQALAQGEQQSAQMHAQASMMNSGFMMNLMGMYLGSAKGPWN